MTEEERFLAHAAWMEVVRLPRLEWLAVRLKVMSGLPLTAEEQATLDATS